MNEKVIVHESEFNNIIHQDLNTIKQFFLDNPSYINAHYSPFEDGHTTPIMFLFLQKNLNLFLDKTSLFIMFKEIGFDLKDTSNDDHYITTLLYLSVQYGDIKLIDYLIDNVFDLENIITSYNEIALSPLFLLVSGFIDTKFSKRNKSNSEKIIYLLKRFKSKGVDLINIRGGKHKRSLLDYSIFNCSLKVVDFLINEGCDLNYLNARKRNCAYGALHNKKSTKVLRYLISKGLDIYNRDDRNENLLGYCLRQHNTYSTYYLKFLNVLFEYPYDIREKGLGGRNLVHFTQIHLYSSMGIPFCLDNSIIFDDTFSSSDIRTKYLYSEYLIGNLFKKHIDKYISKYGSYFHIYCLLGKHINIEVIKKYTSVDNVSIKTEQNQNIDILEVEITLSK